MTHARWLAAPAAAALIVSTPLRATAQIDYRNLDDDRPTRVEDAYAIERYAFELLMPYAAAVRSGEVTQASVLELAYGLVMGLHAGIKLPFAAVATAGEHTRGLAGARAFALYNFNTQSSSLPAFAARVDGFFPVGSLGGDAPRAEFKVIATHSLGRTRAHVNGALGIGPDGEVPAVEGAARWWYGAALDHVLYRYSLLLVGEVYARREAAAAPVETVASLGARWQWTPTLVLDAGVARRLGPVGPDLAVTIGLSHTFAIAGLMPRGPRGAAPGGPDAHRH